MRDVTTALRGRPAPEEFAPASVENPEAGRLAGVGRCDASGNGRSAEHEDEARGIRNILVPTDFSAASTVALERAVALANQCNAAVTLLHVIDINAPAMDGAAEDLMQNLWNRGSAKVGQLALSLCGRVNARTMLQEGIPWETIVQASQNFDLVLMGKGHRRQGRKFFSHHTAQRVLENAACPVMVVPLAGRPSGSSI